MLIFFVESGIFKTQQLEKLPLSAGMGIENLTFITYLALKFALLISELEVNRK